MTTADARLAAASRLMAAFGNESTFPPQQAADLVRQLETALDGKSPGVGTVPVPWVLAMLDAFDRDPIMIRAPSASLIVKYRSQLDQFRAAPQEILK